MITGPGSPSVLSNMAVSIEQHVDWVGACLDHMRARAARRRRADADGRGGLGAARQRLRRHHALPARRTPGTWARTFRGSRASSCPTSAGVDRYRKACDEVVGRDYLGFAFDGPGGARCSDGVVYRLQLDVAMVLDLIERPGCRRSRPCRSTKARARVRRAWRRIGRPGPTVGDVVDGELPGAAGPLAYRRYRPADAGAASRSSSTSTAAAGCSATSTPTIPFCRDLCVRADAIVVSVNYRHAPEARFPAAVDDGFAAVRWIAANAAALGGVPGQLAVCGWSAGGNIAAVVCQMARDAGGPRIAGQVLVTPVTDCDFTRAVVRRERRRLPAHDGADAVVLGSLRRSCRPAAPQGVAAARARSRPACRPRSS